MDLTALQSAAKEYREWLANPSMLATIDKALLCALADYAMGMLPKPIAELPEIHKDGRGLMCFTWGRWRECYFEDGGWWDKTNDWPQEPTMWCELPPVETTT